MFSAGILNEDLASLSSYAVQQHDSSMIKVEENPSDHLMSGESFSSSINTNQPNIHNINQQQMPSQQFNLNASNRMTPTPTDIGPTQQQPLLTGAMGNKTGGNNGGSMEYTQQQSHIFVFSTALANQSAEAVQSGIHVSIVAFHCAQPETRKFLEVSVSYT